MKALFALAALALAFVAAPYADARTIQHPAGAAPALTLELPDTWRSDLREPNLLLYNSPAGQFSLGISVFVGQTTEEPDAIANAVGERSAPFTREADTELAGQTAAVYVRQVAVPGGQASMRMYMVRIDPETMATLTVITFPIATSDNIAEGERVLRSVQIVH